MGMTFRERCWCLNMEAEEITDFAFDGLMSFCRAGNASHAPWRFDMPDCARCMRFDYMHMTVAKLINGAVSDDEIMK